MKTISVGSTNPVKLEAVREGFRRAFPDVPVTLRGCSVPSGVAAQPMSDAETLAGASQRALNARAADPEADFWVGLEGGCEAKFGEMLTFAWIVILARDRVTPGRGRTAAFCLPAKVADLVRQGVELGLADDQVFGRSNSKQLNGAVGLLTGDLIDRRAYYEHAVILALIPFKNPSLFP